MTNLKKNKPSGTKINESLSIGHFYNIECYDSKGNLKWNDDFENIVVTTGRNHYLDVTLKTGTASPFWYVGLKNSTIAVAEDTISNKGFVEITAYTNTTRPLFVVGNILEGSVDNSFSKAEFIINESTVVGGAFLVNQNTKGGTTGILLGAGEFNINRTVIAGDTIKVTITCSITSL